MKVLGLTRVPNASYPSLARDGYIVIVTHDEIAAAFERGYSNKLEALKVGDELNLADIPNQREKIVAATKAMQDAYEKFVKAAPVMAEVARVIGESKAGSAA